MLGINELLAATVLFVGSHFVLAGRALRGNLVQRLGEGGFRLLFSLVAAVTLFWMIIAYNAAPLLAVWPALPELRWVPVLVMPVAFVLVVSGLTTRNPASVGGEAHANAQDPAPGILRITRHPFLWGVALWAFSHIVARGDLATIIMMGGILVLSLGGMLHIDAKREALLGASWGPMKLTTSILPFHAIITGRNEFDWAGIGWWRLLGGVVAYLAVMHLHEVIFGVSALP